MSKLARATYFSRPAVKASRGEVLTQITQISARNNARLEITGVLIAGKGVYAQLLEGPRRQLSELISRIAVDSRHIDFTLVEFRPAHARVVPHWAMNLVRLKPLDGSAPPDFETLEAMNPDEVLRLLARFTPAPAR